MNSTSFVVTCLKWNWIPSVFYLDIYNFLYIWKAFCYIFKVLLSLFLYKGNGPRFWGKPLVKSLGLYGKAGLETHVTGTDLDLIGACLVLSSLRQHQHWGPKSNLVLGFSLLPLAGRYRSPCCIAWGKRLFKVALCQLQCIFSYFLASSRCWGSPLTWFP